MRYLITGGAGFIGSHLADHLIGRGDDVLAMDDLSTGSLRNVAHLDGDPRFQLVRGHDPGPPADGGAHGGRRRRRPPRRRRGGQAHRRTPARVAPHEHPRHRDRAGRRRVRRTQDPRHLDVGDLRQERVRAAAARTPTGSWARRSRRGGRTARRRPSTRSWRARTGSERGVPSIVVRLFNCVGPRQTGEFGMVVPRFVRQALAGEDLTVYGDGEQRRCFCHVLDTVRGAGGICSIIPMPSATCSTSARPTSCR